MRTNNYLGQLEQQKQDKYECQQDNGDNGYQQIEQQSDDDPTLGMKSIYEKRNNNNNNNNNNKENYDSSNVIINNKRQENQQNKQPNKHIQNICDIKPEQQKYITQLILNQLEQQLVANSAYLHRLKQQYHKGTDEYYHQLVRKQQSLYQQLQTDKLQYRKLQQSYHKLQQMEIQLNQIYQQYQTDIKHIKQEKLILMQKARQAKYRQGAKKDLYKDRQSQLNNQINIYRENKQKLTYLQQKIKSLDKLIQKQEQQTKILETIKNKNDHNVNTYRKINLTKYNSEIFQQQTKLSQEKHDSKQKYINIVRQKKINKVNENMSKYSTVAQIKQEIQPKRKLIYNSLNNSNNNSNKSPTYNNCQSVKKSENSQYQLFSINQFNVL